VKSPQRSVSCKIERQVSFYDLDPGQMVWHGNYFNYFEDARRALFASRGIDLVEYSRKRSCFFPVIKTSTRHLYPLRYGDIFICQAKLLDARTIIITDFEIRIKGQKRICVQGRTEQVAVKGPDLEMLLFIPEEIRKAVGF
jgi:acyl-CoA thioester hydrolase